MHILHLDDDPLHLELARAWLEADGHSVTSVQSGAQAIEAVRSDEFDVALLDWMVPDVSGEEVLRWIRERDRKLSVMFLTSNEEEAQIVHILELGADDYLVKPLRRGEFLARVRALARRAGVNRAAAAESLAPYELHEDPRTVALAGRAVKMSARMTDLAFHLFEHRDEIVTRKQIYQRVWKLRKPLESRTIDTFVSRLRATLELDGRHGWRIVSVYQHGYRLEKAG